MANGEKQVLSYRVSNELEIQNVKNFHDLLEAQVAKGKEIELYIPNKYNEMDRIVLVPKFAVAMLEFMSSILNNTGFEVIPHDSRLTVQEAADILNVRSESMEEILLENNISCENIGTRKFVRTEEIFRLKQSWEKDRNEALSELAKQDFCGL